MQKLEKYKTQKLSNFSQLIILNDQGFIEESCDSIFSTSAFLAQPFTLYFPFLESIFELLLDLKVDGKELKYAKIESPLAELPGVYDFTFARVLLDGEKYILWSIYDYTDLYEDFKQYQQKRNELEIHREMLETRNRSLHRQKDLLAQKNLVLQNWDQVRKDYYKQVRLALQSPVNALDGLSFILTKLSKDTDQDYISALRASVKHLQDVLAEFELVAAIDGGNQMPDVQKFDPGHVINKVMEMLFAAIPSHDFELQLHLEKELPKNFLGNPRHLQQILYQLLLNARKFNHFSNLDLNITCTPASGNDWKLSIEILERLSPTLPKPPDEKADTTPPNPTELIYRLSLVKKLIELEGGFVIVENQQDNAGFLIRCLLTYPSVD